MIFSKLFTNRLNSWDCKVLRPFRFIALLAATFALALVTLSVTSGSAGNAAQSMPESPDLRANVAGGVGPGSGGMYETTEALQAPSVSAGQPQEDLAQAGADSGVGSDNQTSPHKSVWSATMIVGRASNSDQAYEGYIPTLSPPIGFLDSTDFSLENVSYAVANLFQQCSGGVIQLVLDTDQNLPEELTLEVGADQFAIGESRKLGLEENIHVWILDSGLDWIEGQTLTVGLLTETQFELQDSDKLVTSNPVALPDGIRFAGTIAAGGAPNGEINVDCQLKVYKLVLDPRSGHRIDKIEQVIGDGTLSDPWISGSNGALNSGHGPRIQPDWYDERGKVTVPIGLPTGEAAQRDQYGRVYTAHTNTLGYTVFPKSMGATEVRCWLL